MRRRIKLIAILALFLLPSMALLAEEALIKPERRQISENIIIEHSSIPDMLGSMDRLLINKSDQEICIFESDGRRIEEVFEKDLDGDGHDEYLVKMDCGGSGGYKDLCLLKLRNNKYEAIWEDSLANARISFREKNDFKPVFIGYIADDKNSKALRMEMALYFKKGKLMKNPNTRTKGVAHVSVGLW